MARRKRKGGKHKTSWVDKIFEIFGIVVAASPAIQGVMAHTGDPQNIPADIGYRYTGFDVNSGKWSSDQAVKGIGTLAAGGVVAAAPRIFRMVRNLIKGRR